MTWGQALLEAWPPHRQQVVGQLRQLSFRQE
jgi:hypothetical protein